MASAMEVGKAPHLSLHFGPEFSVALPTDSQVALHQAREINDMMRKPIGSLREEHVASFVGVPTIHVTAPTLPRQSVIEALQESAEATQRGAVAANALLARSMNAALEGVCCGYEEKQITCWCSGATSSLIKYLLPQLYHRYVM